MSPKPTRRAKGAAGVLAAAALLSCTGTPPPDVPKPATTSTQVVVPPAPPEATAEPAPPPPPPEIGSKYQADPAEPLPPGAVARCGTTRMRAASPVTSAVTNTGSIYAVDSVHYKWLLRDVTRGVDLAPVPDGDEALFTPDGSLLVVSTRSPYGTLAILAVPSGARLGEVKIPLPQKPGPRPKGLFALAGTASIQRIAMSPDGAALVVGTSDGSAHLVDIAARKLVKTIKLPAKSRLAGISRGGARAVVETREREMGGIEAIFSAGYDSLVGYAVVDMHTGATVRKAAFKKLPPDPDDPKAPAMYEHGFSTYRISADGTRVFRLESGEVAAIDVATGTESDITGRSAGGSGHSSSPLGYGLGGLGGRWRSATPFDVIDEGHVLVDDEIVNLADGTSSTVGPHFEAISTDGSRIVTRDGRVYSLSSGEPEMRPSFDREIQSLAFLPDNRLIAIAGKATLWKTDAGVPAEALWNDFQSDPGTASAATKKPAALLTGRVNVMLVDGGEKMTAIPTDNEIQQSAIAPSGDMVFFAGGDYGPHSKLVAQSVTEPPGPGGQREFSAQLQGLAVSAEGDLVAISAGDHYGAAPKSVQLLSVPDLGTTAQVAVDNPGHVAFVGTDLLAHSPSRGGISLYSVPTLRDVKRLHRLYCCEEMAVSPDGKRIAASEGRDLFVWETDTRKLVAHRIRAHREDIEALAFSPDSRYLATGSLDTTVLFWDVAKLGVAAPIVKVDTRVTAAADIAPFFSGTSSTYRVLPDGTLGIRFAPGKVKSPVLKKVTAVTGSYGASCAIAESKVRCWGSTRGGALGVPEQKGTKKWSFAEKSTPTTLDVKDPIDVQMYGVYGCALERGGDLVCWGRLDDKDSPAAPSKILGGVKSFDLVSNSACAVGNDGVVRCWSKSMPVPQALSVKDAVATASGYEHTCILDKAGGVWCRGDNSHDQLGDDTGVDRRDPAAVQGVSGVVAIVAGRTSTCARTSAAVYCWGDIGEAHYDRPTRIPALDGATDVKVENDAVCGLVSGRVDCVKTTDPD